MRPRHTHGNLASRAPPNFHGSGKKPKEVTVTNPSDNKNDEPSEGVKTETPSSSLDDMTATNPLDFTFHEDGKSENDGEEQKHTASILDLIETKDEFISLSGAADVDEIIQGDSLDEI